MRILFITHNSKKAGAPMVLLHLLKWIRQQRPEVNISLLDLNEGDLKKEFVEVSHEYISLTNKNNSYVLKGLHRLTKKKKKISLEDTVTQLHLNSFDLIYANTIKTIPVGTFIKGKNSHAKLVAHVHELPTVIKLLLPDFNTYIEKIDHFIAVSNLVLESLNNNWDIPLNKISMVRAFATVDKITASKKQLEQFHIGASGLVDWRKGYDIFIQVARFIKKHSPILNVKFTWVGSISETQRIIIEEDLLKLGLKDSVFFVGELSNPFDVYNSFDVFLLPSREDPFPLVCIETGMLGIPIVCFEGATGTAEILQQGGGMIVPYLDVEAMAETVMTYYKSPHIRLQDGERAKVLFSNFTAEAQCPKLLAVIETCLER